MRQEIEAAADWWAKTIAGTPKQDNGDAFQSHLMQREVRDNDRPSSEQVAAFREHLLTALLVWFQQPRIGRERILRVDYEPDTMLYAAACFAGIEVRRSTFPVKTTMWIDPGCVEVSCGYGAPAEVIFGVKVEQS